MAAFLELESGCPRVAYDYSSKGNASRSPFSRAAIGEFRKWDTSLEYVQFTGGGACPAAT